jgi:Spy/CpxP family protein refolding chaperone
VRPMRPPPEVNVPPRRQALEREFRQRSEQVVREKLSLSDEQVSRLRAVNAGIGGQRNALLAQERSVRLDLRDEMAQGGAADQSKVSQLMTQARDLQGRRFALQQDEEQQLSSFMTPVQVAQYVGLQAQIRQRMREMQQSQNGEQVVPNP